MIENTNTSSSVQENAQKTSTIFMKAIENNDLDTINTFLENGTINEGTLNKGLIKALQNYRSNSDSIEIIDSLLNKNANPNNFVNYKTINMQINIQDKVTILMYACYKGDIQLVHTILKHDKNVNMKDVYNRNALFYAINTDKGDNADVVMLLINSGINLNECERDGHIEGNSPLTLATQKNMTNTVKILLDNGANPNFRVSKDLNTALHYAVQNSSKEIIEKLLTKNADLKAQNKNGLTPLNLVSCSDLHKLLNEENNKILNREKEIAYALITEEEYNLNNNLTISNSINKSKKKKYTKEELTDTNRDDSDNDWHCDKNEMSNKDKKSSSASVSANYSINIIPPSNNTYHEDQLQQDNNFEKNKKSELNSKIKDNEQDQNYYSNKYSRSKLNTHNNKNIINTNYNSNTQITNSSCELVEIPLELSNKGNSHQFKSYIKIKTIPTLYLDFSNKAKEDAAILRSLLNEAAIELAEKNKNFKSLDDALRILNDENQRLKKENFSNIEMINNKDKYLNELHLQWKIKEDQYSKKIEELELKLDNSIMFNEELADKYKKLEKEMSEINSKKYTENLNTIKIKEFGIKKDFLEKKFSTSKYEDKYIIKCLQKDILDFQEYTKDQIRKNKPGTDELLRLVQTAVNECIPDFEVKLFGSHATNLCLPWSDLDIVLVNKRTQYSSNYGVLQSLYLNMYDKPWKRSIKFIDTAVIPIIKLTATEEFNSLQMDISLQDGKHYGLKCVELVKSFMDEYEALEPLIFALKNLLKNANLNDPYTGGLSSYGLILMVVSYLQSQLEGNKPIKIADGNIGRLFLEFLCYYGLIFDHTKYVIYTYPPTDLNYVDKDNNNFFFNMQSGHELIIVDPLNKSNNVARSTYQFVNIKMAFMIGFVVSREECECGCHFNAINEFCIISNSDHCILKRIFNSVKRFNANANN